MYVKLSPVSYLALNSEWRCHGFRWLFVKRRQMNYRSIILALNIMKSKIDLPIVFRLIIATFQEFEIFSKCDSEGLAHKFKKLNTLLMLPHATRSVRQGWVFSERTRNLSGFQFTRHFIEFVCEETNQFDGNNPNVIAGFMQQT